MTQIRPIETQYNGYKFRSRAEARWAVYFDELGIKYQYEPEGFLLSDGTMYLPDFYLPNAKQFFEVKGVMTDRDQHKIDMLIKDFNCGMAIGYPDLTFIATSNYGEGIYEFESSYGGSLLCRCRKCGNFYFMGQTGIWDCSSCGFYDGDNGFEVYTFGDQSNILNEKAGCALEKARKERFEQKRVKERDYKTEQMQRAMHMLEQLKFDGADEPTYTGASKDQLEVMKKDCRETIIKWVAGKLHCMDAYKKHPALTVMALQAEKGGEMAMRYIEKNLLSDAVIEYCPEVLKIAEVLSA